MRYRHLICIISLISLLLLSGCSGKEHKLTIGMIYSGPTQDYGVNESEDEALEELISYYNGEISTIVKSNVDGNSFSSVVYDMVNNGAGLIFVNDTNFAQLTQEAAAAYPNVKFISLNNPTSAGNLKRYAVDNIQSNYLAGILSGNMTQSNYIGLFASSENLYSYQNADAFALGVQSVNPEAIVQVTYLGENPSQTAMNAAVSKLAFNGCDIMFSLIPDNRILIQAANNGVKVIGNSSNGFDKNENLVAVISTDYYKFFNEQIENVINNTFNAEPVALSIADGLIKIGDYTPEVSQTTRNSISDAEKGLKNGTKAVFSGPILNNAGNPVIGEGEFLSEEQIATLNFYINNIQIIQ